MSNDDATTADDGRDSIAHGPAGAGLLVILAAAIWGSGGLFIRAAALPPQAFSFFRMAVPVIVLGGWFLLRRHRLSREHLRLRLFASTLNAVRMYFYYLAFDYTTVATATVALYAWPIFATAFGWLLLGEPVGRRRAGLLFLAFAGVPLLYLPGSAITTGDGASAAAARVVADAGPGELPFAPFSRDVVGISSMLLSAAIHALVVVLLRRARAGNSRFETTFFQNLVGAVAFAVIFFAAGIDVTPRQITIGLSLGAWVGVVGFTLFFVGLHRLGAAGASVLTYTEVIVAVILGTVVLREPLAWNTVAGGVLILVALVLAQRQLKRS